MFSAAAVAQVLDEAHATRARYANLPEPIAPKSFAEAYAAQEALCALWEPRFGPVAGRKIAVTTKVMQELMGIDHPCMGAVFASRILGSPAKVAKAQFVNLRVECELAVRLGRDLPKERAPYTRESVRAAVLEIMAAFELIEDRNADYRSCQALSLIADNAWNGGIVLGAAKPPPAQLDFNGIGGRLTRDGREELSGMTDDPLGALAFLANLAADRGRPLTARMVVITGSIVPTVDIGIGERLDFAIDGVGDVTMWAT
jgi:2-keto-4-pentenoate hydratase